MKKQIVALILGCLAAPISTVAAPRYSDWSVPVNLGPAINTAFGDRHPAIGKKGLSLFFSSDRPGGQGGDDLWLSRRPSVNHPWGTPQNLGATVNTPGTEYAPAFSRDGHWMLFISSRAGGHGAEDIWASYREHVRDDFGWEPPINLGTPINSAQDDGAPTLVEDEDNDTVTLYFASNRPGGAGDFDIYAAEWNADGSFSPAALLTEINSPARDTRTAIRRDGLELFITSGRPGTLGPLDLWVSVRGCMPSAWSSPINLGAVNTTAADGAPALSPDGLTLFFYSNRPGGFGGNDLYMTTREKLRKDDED